MDEFSIVFEGQLRPLESDVRWQRGVHSVQPGLNVEGSEEEEVAGLSGEQNRLPRNGAGQDMATATTSRRQRC